MVEGSGFRVWGLEFDPKGNGSASVCAATCVGGCGFQGLEVRRFGVHGLGVRVQGSGLRVLGWGISVQSFRCRMHI